MEKLSWEHLLIEIIYRGGVKPVNFKSGGMERVEIPEILITYQK